MSSRKLHRSDTGRRLSKVRGWTSLSARGLSQLAGLTDSVVAMVERGAIHNPSYVTLDRLSETLGVPLSWLASGVGAPPKKKKVLAAVEAARARNAATEKGAAA